MQHYPPGQSRGLPSDQPGQQWGPAQYNQPTWGWQQPPMLPPVASPSKVRRGKAQRPPKPPKKPPTKKETMIGLGCLGVIALLLCALCGTIANAMNTNGNTSTSSPSPTATQASVLIATAATHLVPTPTSKPTTKPTPTPTPTQVAVRPTPTPTQATGVNGNPWGYNFTPGNLIYSPNAAFCDYFTCVSTFWTATRGYVAECANGSYTHSGGVSGACSRDGGVSRPLYSH